MLTRAFISTALWTLSFCGTRQFHVVNVNKNWTDAQKYCREKFTDLATIESKEEMNALLVGVIGTEGLFWIGLSQNVEQNIWIWSDVSNFSYRYWNTGEPNNPVGDVCVILWNPSTYRWNDLSFYYLHPFICYKPLGGNSCLLCLHC
uniref:C-type lectin domain-containing protein n=1 Tax=Pygocentrus nattereri TaxID=42514 RepID=A0A3B4C2P9_PYGNA